MSNFDKKIFCMKVLPSRSKYDAICKRRCHQLKKHSGNCDEFPFLKNFKQTFPKVANKIKRDSTMTTGAAWKSEEAGPNRILRWVMLLDDSKLKKYGINMKRLKPQVVSKLREKAADYDSCISVAMGLTHSAYQMIGAPTPPDNIKKYLETVIGRINPGTTKCLICLLPLPFSLFAQAQRGRAPIETCHKEPRAHTPENVGFAHRECNIAQGPKSLKEFYEWVLGIVKRAMPDEVR